VRDGGGAAAISGSVNAFFNQPTFGGDQSPKTPPRASTFPRVQVHGALQRRAAPHSFIYTLTRENTHILAYIYRYTYTLASNPRRPCADGFIFLARGFFSPRDDPAPLQEGFPFFFRVARGLVFRFFFLFCFFVHFHPSPLTLCFFPRSAV